MAQSDCVHICMSGMFVSTYVCTYVRMYACSACMQVRRVDSRVKACVCGRMRRDDPSLCVPPAHPSTPSPSLPQEGRAHTLERLMPCTSILPCHGAIRLEFSLSGSVGPFASLMIALMPCTRMWEGFLPVACFICFFSCLPFQGSPLQFRKSLMSRCGHNLSKAE